MSEQFAIWGSAGHAKVLASLVVNQGGKVVAFFDNRDVSPALPGVSLYVGEVGFHTWAAQTAELFNITGLIAIGGHGGHDRINIQRLFRAAGMRLLPIKHPAAFVCDTAQLGAGTQVLAQAIVAADTIVGEVCIVNHKASIDHECLIGDGVHVAPGATICGCVRIGDNVLVGAGAVILPRVSIGANAIVGAGAVVTKDVPDGAVVVGNPAR